MCIRDSRDLVLRDGVEVEHAIARRTRPERAPATLLTAESRPVQAKRLDHRSRDVVPSIRAVGITAWDEKQSGRARHDDATDVFGLHDGHAARSLLDLEAKAHQIRNLGGEPRGTVLALPSVRRSLRRGALLPISVQSKPPRSGTYLSLIHI